MRGQRENLGGVLVQHCNVLDEDCNGSLGLGITCVVGRGGGREGEGEREKERGGGREGKGEREGERERGRVRGVSERVGIGELGEVE